MFSRARCFSRRALTAVGTVAVVLVFASVAGAGSNFQNGNFETGDFTGWTVNQVGGGNWFVSNKTLTPINQFSWKGPAEKEYAAVTDQGGQGTNILYQTIDVGSKTTKVSLIVYYKNRASLFCTPATLDYTAGCNQQYRIDILRDGAPIDSMASSDVLKTLFKTKTTSPLSLSPTKVSKDITGLGAKVILRVAEVDNQFYFNASIDDVRVDHG